MDVLQLKWARSLTGMAVVALSAVVMQGQADEHGRKYKAPPPTAHIVVTVQKGFNQKPLMNAAVIFHATRDGHSDGNLEVKTDPNGNAAIDVIEVGSHLTVQVIARGFATYSTEFDVDSDKKELLIKMLRPKAQISQYEDNDGKDSDIKPGVQQHVTHAPGTAPATAPAPAGTPK